MLEGDDFPSRKGRRIGAGLGAFFVSALLCTTDIGMTTAAAPPPFGTFTALSSDQELALIRKNLTCSLINTQWLTTFQPTRVSKQSRFFGIHIWATKTIGTRNIE